MLAVILQLNFRVVLATGPLIATEVAPIRLGDHLAKGIVGSLAP